MKVGQPFDRPAFLKMRVGFVQEKTVFRPILEEEKLRPWAPEEHNSPID